MANTKSANVKTNAKRASNPDANKLRVERRALNMGVVAHAAIPVPTRAPKSKYPYSDLTSYGMYFDLADCSDGNAAAIKATGKTKFHMKLMSVKGPIKADPQHGADAVPAGGYRFIRVDKVADAEADADADDSETKGEQVAA